MQSERLIHIFTEDTPSPPEPVVIAKTILQIEGLSKTFGGKPVLQDVNFSVAQGESLVLLGESGSGKTTILRIIAGLETADNGQVLLHDKNVTGLPSRQRNIGLIFQDYSLFPRMTAEENISFGLRIRGKSRKELRAIVDRLIELVKLDEHRKKLPSQLSGGQQQRVAIARALAYGPQVLLFDEPFAALDANTRSSVRREVVALLKEQKVPAIFITHDREEAMEIGDRIAVLNKGVLEQVGTPKEIYDYPKTEYVASFIGQANVISGIVRGSTVRIGATTLPAHWETREFNEGQKVKVIFRPEDVSLVKSGTLPADERLLATGTIDEITFAGFFERIKIKLDPMERVPGDINHRIRRPDFVLNLDQSDITIIANRTRAETSALPVGVRNRVIVSLKSFRLISV
ncbi:MAG TPA: ABC transporter ATP-binding protein [Blastocatellia bacterium]|nr:ABC transporter ATP-binding protein [Blastocatellia bacterium]